MDERIAQLAQDFDNERGPFSVDNFPEAKLVDELGDEGKENYLSLFCTLDYNRRVDNLVANIVELSGVDDGYGTDYFEPEDVVEVPEDEMRAVFTDIGFRYGNRDAMGWRENCETVANQFYGDWGNLHERVDYNAPRLVAAMRKLGLKFIKGKKLAPFYARVVNDFVHPLDEVWALDIPVDVHIRRLSRDLFQNPDMSDDAIRAKWREIGQSSNISPAIVDGALWQIGYSWDDWGEDYWEAL